MNMRIEPANCIRAQESGPFSDPYLTAAERWKVLSRSYGKLVDATTCSRLPAQRAYLESLTDEAFDALFECADELIQIVPSTREGLREFALMMLDDAFADDADRLRVGMQTLAEALSGDSPA